MTKHQETIEQVINQIPDYKLKNMVRDYLECALWSSNNEEDEIDTDEMSIYDADILTVWGAITDCYRFSVYANYWVKQVNPNNWCRPEAARNIGHDFWLTRNHHGAGFWDGDYDVIDDDGNVDKSLGEKLTARAEKFGELTFEVWLDEIDDEPRFSIR